VSPAVSLRPAEPGDVERILLVHVAAILDAGPDAYDDRQVAAWAAKTEGVDRYLEAIDDPKREVLVATDPSEGTVVGFYERRGYDRLERVVTETTAGVAVESVWMEKELDV
jgi:hypothetical protein